MENSELQVSKPTQEEAEEILRVDGIFKKLGKNNVLNDISFSVKAGEVLGLIGPNGAGKTTTLRIITGLLTPDKGSVTVSGFDIKKQREKALSKLWTVPSLMDR